MSKSQLETTAELHIRAANASEPEREYRFAAMMTGGVGRGTRARLAQAGFKDWRFDFAWPSAMIAFEVEGGTWANGRHSRGAGFREDCEKYNAATLTGWRVFRFTSGMVNDGKVMELASKLVASGLL